ncbi:MAG: type 1 glutamine amidotransferase [Alphaproteobacteria bacterium]
MKFLVLQHLSVEHPGILRDFWLDAGITWDAVELDEGATIPSNLAAYDALVVMGGPMDVWEEDEYPWLKVEKAAIRDWVVEQEKPFLGICLGHQLLAEAIGGTVGRMATPEVGINRMSCPAAAREDAIMSRLPAEFDGFQWHGAEVKTLPPGTEILATNEYSPVQAFRWKTNAYGFQYHVELTKTTVADWADVPAYKTSLEAVMGPGACPRLEQDVSKRLAKFNESARQLNDGFLELVGGKARHVA